MNMAEIFPVCVRRVRGARNLAEAESAYYCLPYRDTLLGHVAKATWEGYGMELVTSVLGMCGIMEYPPESVMVRSLRTLSDMMDEGEEERMVLAKLIVACAMGSPMEMTTREMKIIASELSWRCPMGGETEAMLVERFPDMLSLPSVFQAKMEAHTKALQVEFGDPYKIIGELIERNAALTYQLENKSFRADR